MCCEAYNPGEVGSEGRGYLWKSSKIDDAEEEELTQCIWGNTHKHLHENFILVACVVICVCGHVVLGLVLKSDPDSETESETSEGSHDPGSRSESPELDDVRGTDAQLCLKSQS